MLQSLLVSELANWFALMTIMSNEDNSSHTKLIHPCTCDQSYASGNSQSSFNPLNANITKWSNTLKQFVGKLPTNCLSVFDHFVGLALKGLSILSSFDTES